MRTTKRIITTLLFCLAPLVLAQESTSKPQETAPAKAEADGFYSGTVAELAEDKVTVLRAILGKPAERRVFLINAETKVEGKMKPKSRVTVKFAGGDEGDIALSILVREKVDKKK